MLEKLKSAKEFKQHASEVSQKVSVEELENKFNQCLDRMTGGHGGHSTISFGRGAWLHMIQGKKVLPQIINSQCFKVKDTDGNFLQGKKKPEAIIKELLKKDEAILPADFKELKRLISTRVKESQNWH